jgi:hypothetical protein
MPHKLSHVLIHKACQFAYYSGLWLVFLIVSNCADRVFDLVP